MGRPASSRVLGLSPALAVRKNHAYRDWETLGTEVRAEVFVVELEALVDWLS